MIIHVRIIKLFRKFVKRCVITLQKIVLSAAYHFGSRLNNIQCLACFSNLLKFKSNNSGLKWLKTAHFS